MEVPAGAGAYPASVSQSELELALSDAGGARAPREYGARLRRLLFSELERGAGELAKARSGRDHPVAVALARGGSTLLAVLPLDPRLRADPAAVPDRGFDLAAAAVGALVEASEPGPPSSASELGLLMGADERWLVLAYPSDELGWRADYAREALDEACRRIDRLRERTFTLPGHVLEPADLRPPNGATHPLRVAETISRLGGSPLDGDSAEALEEQVLGLLEPPEAVARAHDDPDPRRRTMRRILQRLDGMGKWGGYHTAFDHLARGFAGNERALANEVGEELVAAGLLAAKPSVGQRHVFLNPRRAGDIRRLIDAGELPPELQRP
jgi:hypothetical protein